MRQFKVGDRVKLHYNETGTIVKIKNIPFGFKYVVRIRKGSINKTNQHVDCRAEDMELEITHSHLFFEAMKYIEKLKANPPKCPYCGDNSIIPYFGIDNPSGDYITICCKTKFKPEPSKIVKKL